MAFLHTYHCQNFLYPLPSIQKVLICKESSENAMKDCGHKNWIEGWGVFKIWKNNILILLILIQKLYFVDDDAMYDVIIQEPVWKWRHYNRHEISRDSFAEVSLSITYSTIFIFRQIDRANFAVRSPSSF